MDYKTVVKKHWDIFKVGFMICTCLTALMLFFVGIVLGLMSNSIIITGISVLTIIYLIGCIFNEYVH